MNKVLAILSLLLILASGSTMAQGYGSYSSSNDIQSGEELPIPQPTPAVDVPPPTDFGQDSLDDGDYSGTDN